MNEKYWSDFYNSNEPVLVPSTFAHSALVHLIPKPEVLVDLGGGNGRDSIFFTNYCNQVLYVDQVDGLGINVSAPDNLHKVIGHLELESTWQEIRDFVCGVSSVYFYARFLIHALDFEELDRFLNNISSVASKNDIFFLEYRVKDSKVELNYDNHARVYYEPTLIEQKLTNLAWREVSIEVGKGLAIFRSEDPMICRQVFVKVI